MEVGREGEKLAVKFLRELGYQVLEVNWRAGKHEIDIIARDKNVVVVAEVKSRNSNYFAEPEYNVTRSKQKALIQAANSYVFRKNIQDEVRFDIIAIVINNGKHRINHIIDAFYPTIR